MKIRRLLWMFFLLAFSIRCAASDSLITRMVPLTGMHDVKVLLYSADTKKLTDLQYQVNIRAVSDSSLLWQGTIAGNNVKSSIQGQGGFRITDLSPVLWYPSHPFLYEITVKAFQGKALQQELRQRLGFRSFSTQKGNLYLNGKPIFLRGIAINPPGRGIPDSVEKSRRFAEDYVSFMKSIHVNIIRIPDNETWYNVCDELGMMVFGGNYSGSVNGQKPPQDYDRAVAWYENKKFAPIAHHPSLMIYAMTNEVAFRGDISIRWKKFLSYAHNELLKWDSSRVYIGNAGYGYGQSGDICDIHRYWGWYYSSPFTFLHIRNNEAIIPFKKGMQPITFTECVGNYSGPDGRYNLTPDHKNPGSQLSWTGHADDDIQARLANEHQCFTFKQATELFRRLRVINPELSGVFPFTILFYNWHTVKEFIDMDPKPVTAQARLSYQPVLLSWECWTPQVYAGSEIRPTVHIVNDDDDFNDLHHAKLVYQLTDDTRSVVFADSMAIPDVPYYSTYQRQLAIRIPSKLPQGKYRLVGKIIRNGTLISENYNELYISNKDVLGPAKNPARNIVLYDPSGKTAASLQKLGLSFKKANDFNGIPSSSCLVIGENAADNKLSSQAPAIKRFIKSGGRVLCLRQDAAHLPILNSMLNCPIQNVTMDLDTPVYPPPPRPSRNGYYVNPERPGHPVFYGIQQENLKVWSDYTAWDESKKGFPSIYPVTDGFIPVNKNDISHIAVLGNYGVALQAIALAEVFNDKGTVMLCGFDLVNRTGLDPVADRLLTNLVRYMGSTAQHELYPLITAPIVWGDYTSEKGLLTGVNSGLLLNSKPRLTGSYSKIKLNITKEGHEFAGSRGGFNTRPGLQYVAYGRRPFGPYSLRGFGNIPEADKDNDNIGAGKFWCRVPGGKTSASTLVWNPAKEALKFMVSVNGKQVSMNIEPGAKQIIRCPVNSQTVAMQFSGDRRLVILETAFD